MNAKPPNSGGTGESGSEDVSGANDPEYERGYHRNNELDKELDHELNRLQRLIAQVRPAQVDELPTELRDEVLSIIVGAGYHDTTRLRVRHLAREGDVGPTRSMIENLRRSNERLEFILSEARMAELPDVQRAVAVRKRIEEQASLVEQARLKAERYEGEFAQLMQSLREQGALATASMQVKHFQDEATTFGKQASRWLRWTAGLGLITAGVAAAYFGMALLMEPPANLQAQLQLLLAKVLVFSVSLTATIWAAKTYRANRHNEVVNDHRANALATVGSLVLYAGEDSAAKRAVLLLATESIFTQQPSAFADDTKDEKPVGTKLIEALRATSSET